MFNFIHQIAKSNTQINTILNIYICFRWIFAELYIQPLIQCSIPFLQVYVIPWLWNVPKASCSVSAPLKFFFYEKIHPLFMHGHVQGASFDPSFLTDHTSKQCHHVSTQAFVILVEKNIHNFQNVLYYLTCIYVSLHRGSAWNQLSF